MQTYFQLSSFLHQKHPERQTLRQPTDLLTEREREREGALKDWKTECLCTAEFVTTKVNHYIICMPHFFFILRFILLLFPYLRMGCRRHTLARRNDSVRLWLWLSHNHHK